MDCNLEVLFETVRDTDTKKFKSNRRLCEFNLLWEVLCLQNKKKEQIWKPMKLFFSMKRQLLIILHMLACLICAVKMEAFNGKHHQIAELVYFNFHTTNDINGGRKKPLKSESVQMKINGLAKWLKPFILQNCIHAKFVDE